MEEASGLREKARQIRGALQATRSAVTSHRRRPFARSPASGSQKEERQDAGTSRHPNHRATTPWHAARTPGDHSPTSRHADRLRTDVANVESGLEVIMEQVAGLATRKKRWGSVLMGMLGGSAFTIVLALAFFSTEVFWR
jgi:hypothetical protein